MRKKKQIVWIRAIDNIAIGISRPIGWFMKSNFRAIAEHMTVLGQN